MAQDILITPGSGEPQILFRGSGTTDSPIELNIMSSYQSATGSGTALLFEGQEGLLFSITDNLSSGTIFSVSDITGLPSLEVDASGDVKLAEYGNSVIVYRGLKTPLNTETTAGGTITFDMDVSNLHELTVSNGNTLAVSNVDVGQRFILRLAQPAGGGASVSWFSTISWPGGLVPTLSTTAGDVDVFGFICTGAGTYDGFVIGYGL